MAKAVPEHKDKLGRDLKIGDVVAFPTHNSLEIGQITKLNPKMINLDKVPASKWGGHYSKYPRETVLIEGADLTMYLLTAQQ